MEIISFAKGLIIGVSIAAPVGPIGVLCIQRTVTFGKTSGLITGLGAATADGFYGTVAAFSLIVISNFLVEYQFLFRLIGGAFLLYLGTKTFFSKYIKKDIAVENYKGLFSDYLSAVFLTIANPMTILSFVGIFSGLGLYGTNASISSAIFMVVGVIAGSMLWWTLLTGSIGLLRQKISTRGLVVVNKISGTIILVFAALSFYSLFV